MIFPFSEACSDLPLPAFANGVGQGHPGVLRAKGALQKYFYEMENRETLGDEKFPWGEDYPEIKSNMRLLWTGALPGALYLLPDHSCSSTTPATSGLGYESTSCHNYLSVIAQRSGLLMPGQRLKGAAGMVARSIPSPLPGSQGCPLSQNSC